MRRRDIAILTRRNFLYRKKKKNKKKNVGKMPSFFLRGYLGNMGLWLQLAAAAATTAA